MKTFLWNELSVDNFLLIKFHRINYQVLHSFVIKKSIQVKDTIETQIPNWKIPTPPLLLLPAEILNAKAIKDL